MFDNFRKPVTPKTNNDTPAPAPGFGDVDIWDTGTPDAPAGAPQGGFFPQGNDASQSDITQDPIGTFNNAPTHNVLNQDVTVEGILRFTDDLLVDGQVVGEITSGAQGLTVEEVILKDGTRVVATDRHKGFAGRKPDKNVYTLKVTSKVRNPRLFVSFNMGANRDSHGRIEVKRVYED